jgi:hypothetical protein
LNKVLNTGTYNKINLINFLFGDWISATSAPDEIKDFKGNNEINKVQTQWHVYNKHYDPVAKISKYMEVNGKFNIVQKMVIHL